MNFLTLLYLVGVSLLISLIFVYALKMRGPWSSFWPFFIVILLSVLAANLWIKPIGPYYQNIYWLPPLVTGFLIALLMAATNQGSRSRSKPNHDNENPLLLRATAFTIGNSFWLLLVIMLIIVGIGVFKVIA